MRLANAIFSSGVGKSGLENTEDSVSEFDSQNTSCSLEAKKHI